MLSTWNDTKTHDKIEIRKKFNQKNFLFRKIEIASICKFWTIKFLYFLHVYGALVAFLFDTRCHHIMFNVHRGKYYKIWCQEQNCDLSCVNINNENSIHWIINQISLITLEEHGKQFRKLCVAIHFLVVIHAASDTMCRLRHVYMAR